jgi:hypothetical protein
MRSHTRRPSNSQAWGFVNRFLFLFVGPRTSGTVLLTSARASRHRKSAETEFKVFSSKVVKGWFVLDDSSFSKRAAFAEAERRAQSNDVGLWGFDSGSTATPTPTATATPTPDEGNGGGGATPTPPPPSDGDYDCSDFDSQSAAQQVYEASQDDEYRLDSDADGEACGSLS